MLTSTIRRGMPAAVLLVAGLALAACGPDDASSSSTSGGSGSSSSAGQQGGSSTAAGGGSTGGGSAGAGDSTGGGKPAPATSAGRSGGASHSAGSGSGTAAAATCATGQLHITTKDAGAGAGHLTFQIDFQNTGSAPCALRGYPGVSFVSGSGSQLGKAASRNGGPSVTVTLPPNGHAQAEAQAVNGQSGYSSGDCGLANVPSLRVYPPNETASATIPWNRDECVAPTVQNLSVGPVHAG